MAFNMCRSEYERLKIHTTKKALSSKKLDKALNGLVCWNNLKFFREFR